MGHFSKGYGDIRKPYIHGVSGEIKFAAQSSVIPQTSVAQSAEIAAVLWKHTCITEQVRGI